MIYGKYIGDMGAVVASSGFEVFQQLEGNFFNTRGKVSLRCITIMNR